MATTTQAAAIRELFVEELAEVRGGLLGDCGPVSEVTGLECATTMMCCEEGPFDGCCEVGP